MEVKTISQTERYSTELEHLKSNGMYRTIPNIDGQGKWIKEGYITNPLLNLSSNDYLGIFEKEYLAQEFIQKHMELSNNNSGENTRNITPRFSSASSRLLTGNNQHYSNLEKLLCEKFNKEASLVFNSGYHANIGILPALCNKESLIIADKLVHASIIDGIKLSGCNFIRFKHNDCNHLELILKKELNNYKSIIVVTESLFSMGGDEAPLTELAQIKRKYPQIMLYIDEAHSFGIAGKTGLGLCEKYGILDDVDLLVATFGKAISSVGAFVVCEKVIKEYLVNKMRPLIFSTALPSINIEWSRFIIERLSNFQREREHLEKISKLLREALSCTTSNSHIITHITGEAQAAVELSGRLKSNGIYALPVRPPTVPQGEAGIRFSLTASITEDDINRLIGIISIN